jgi:hypothetical protein
MSRYAAVSSQHDETEIMGGAYHVIYDAFYVIIYNAAKHSKPEGKVNRIFELIKDDDNLFLLLTFSSENKEDESDEYVAKRIQLSETDDIDNAQLSEDRSGIRKLYHFNKHNKDFKLNSVRCENSHVTIQISYLLGH